MFSEDKNTKSKLKRRSMFKINKIKLHVHYLNEKIQKQPKMLTVLAMKNLMKNNHYLLKVLYETTILEILKTIQMTVKH